MSLANRKKVVKVTAVATEDVYGVATGLDSSAALLKKNEDGRAWPI